MDIEMNVVWFNEDGWMYKGPPRYDIYLQTTEWKRIAKKRKQFDGNKCVVCGRPFDLNVHHLNYENQYNEDLFDLVTLCKKHHEEIEDMKPDWKYPSDSFLLKILARQFCKENEEKDLSGELKTRNYCCQDQIKEDFFPFVKERWRDYKNLGQTNIIQYYFSEKRRRIIEDYIRKGYPDYLIHNKTLFSMAQIQKTRRKLQDEQTQ